MITLLSSQIMSFSLNQSTLLQHWRWSPDSKKTVIRKQRWCWLFLPTVGVQTFNSSVLSWFAIPLHDFALVVLTEKRFLPFSLPALCCDCASFNMNMAFLPCTLCFDGSRSEEEKPVPGCSGDRRARHLWG